VSNGLFLEHALMRQDGAFRLYTKALAAVVLTAFVGVLWLLF
jgi:hypothetical protein